MTSIKTPLIRHILEQLEDSPFTDPFHWLQKTGQTFSLRRLDLVQDLPIIHQWVNQEYALPFWGMNGSFSMLFDTYQYISLSSFSASLTGWLGHQLICQIDIYDPFYDPVHLHYDYATGDLGFHLLMAPGRRPFPNGTAKIVWFFLQSVFRCHRVSRVIGEPDAQNEKAQQMLRQLHFEYTGPITLPHKQAAFYTLTRNQYISQTVSSSL